MTDLVKANSNALGMKIAYAERLAQAGLLPQAYRQQPANVLLIVEQAEALGIPFASALNGIHVIDGRPSVSPALMSGLVRRAGHKLRVTGDDTRAVAEIVRADDPDFTFRSEWTLERAKQAGLAGRGQWSKYPAAMLKARAISEVCRDACQEVLAGVYTTEELNGDVAVTADGDVVAATVVDDNPFTPVPDAAVEALRVKLEGDDTDTVDAEIVDDSPTWEERIADAHGIDDLRDLYRELISAGLLEVHGPEVIRRVDELKAAS